MKTKLSIMLIAIIGFTAISFATSNKNNVVKKTKEKKVITAKTKSTTEEDEALHCKVTATDGTVYECWLCNCGNLIKSIQK